MAAVTAPKRHKLSGASVIGKIVVFGEDGNKIGQWGGTEAVLSRETGTGFVLLVRKGQNQKRFDGTIFKLAGLKTVLGNHAKQGKLTLVIPHLQRMCSIYITTTESIPALEYMAKTLTGDKTRWKDEFEVNLARPDLRKPTENRKGPADEDPDDTYGDVIETAQHGEGAGPTAEDGQFGLPIRVASVRNLTSQQQRAWMVIEQGNNVFVTGPAGSGKTEFINHVANQLKQSSPQHVAVTAVTGVAARAISGSTIHSYCGIGLGEGAFDQILQRVKSRDDVFNTWRQLRYWIIDEIGMVSSELLHLLDQLSRAIKKKPSEPFGGIQMILVGDFLQLPPITKNGAEPQYCFESHAWRQLGLKPILLDQSFRHSEDQLLDRALQDVRMGEYTPVVQEALTSCLHRELRVTHGVVPTKIMSLNKDVDAVNAAKLDEIDGPFRRYQAEDRLNVASIDIDREVTLVPSLVLKVGAQVVVVANVPDLSLQNGDRGTVVDFVEATHDQHEPEPIVRFVNGIVCAVPRLSMDVTARNGSVLATRRQVPLRLAWALTVHKCQGMTLPYAEIALNQTFFEFGQAYVALSRVRHLQDLSLSALDPSVIRAPERCLQMYQMMFPQARRQQLDRDVKRAEEEASRKRAREAQELSERAVRPLIDEEVADAGEMKYNLKHRRRLEKQARAAARESVQADAHDATDEQQPTVGDATGEVVDDALRYNLRHRRHEEKKKKLQEQGQPQRGALDPLFHGLIDRDDDTPQISGSALHHYHHDDVPSTSANVPAVPVLKSDKPAKHSLVENWLATTVEKTTIMDTTGEGGENSNRYDQMEGLSSVPIGNDRGATIVPASATAVAMLMDDD